MGLLPAVELSFLYKQEQQVVYSVITYEDATPSYAQAIRIRKLSKENEFKKVLKKIIYKRRLEKNELFFVIKVKKILVFMIKYNYLLKI